MNGSTSQLQLRSNSVTDLVDATVIVETPISDEQYDAIEAPQSPIPESLEWNTSLVSQICREGDITRLRFFTEYSQQTSRCGKHAAEIADRLDKETGLSPLHHAARYQQLHICLILLSNIEFELGVNIKDEHGRTPIHSAFRLSTNSHSNKSEAEKLFDIDIDFGNKIEEVEAWQEEYKTKILTSDHPLIYLFAKAKGDLNARDKYHLTPLHYAVARNNLNGVKQLITFNVDIESKDRQEMRPLHYACRDGYLAIAEYLIEKGAKINAIDDDNYTPLHYACAKGHLDIIKFIKSKDQLVFQNVIQIRTKTKASCIHLAVQYGNIALVEYILKEFSRQALDILINEQAEPFGTPLHIAAKFSDPPLINLLHHHGANPLLLNSLDQSVLHTASLFNRLDIVKALLSLTDTSLLEIKDRRGQTALFLTTNTNIIDELIRFGADLSSCDRKHMNVLMFAVSKNRISIVEHLLSNMNNKRPDIFEQLTKKKHLSIFLLAVYTGSIRMCSALLNHPHVRWDTVDKHRMNIFHIAARNDHYELIEFLCNHIRKSIQIFLDKNLSSSSPVTTTDWDTINLPPSSPLLRLYLDAQNEDGKTPLHLAAEEGRRLCIEVLLKYNANVLIPNFLGQSALHMAIQNGHSRCVEILLEVLMRNMADFQLVLSRRQSPLITACQHGFIDIVQLLLSHGIGIDDKSNEKNENPLEIAIKHRQIPVINELLNHSHMDDWLMPIRQNKDNTHQTPLRDMIRYTPECAKHAFDRFVIKTREIDLDGNTFERTTYKYKYIDDYFTNTNQLYDNNRHHLYRNHPFIIALDTNQHFLLEHPLARQLLKRKWKIYRSVFYFYLLLRLILLIILSAYVLIVPAPNIESSFKKSNPFLLAIQCTIVILGGVNLFRLISEIIRYRGLRVPFAQTIGFLSYITVIIAFLPFESDNHMLNWQWELAAFSTSFQWFNMAFKSRPVPFIGNCIVLFQSILFNFLSLIFVIVPLLVAFTIATNMIFYNQRSFVTNFLSIHKLSPMIVGEFEFEKLFYSQPTLTIASVIFIPFMIIMTIVFMNLFLGLTVGDIQNCMDNARLKAKSYRIREVIYIESTLPSLSQLKLNTPETETDNIYPKDSISIRTNENDEDAQESLTNRQRSSQHNKLLEVLNMLCAQAKHVLDKEIRLERLLKQLLSIRTVETSKRALYGH